MSNTTSSSQTIRRRFQLAATALALALLIPAAGGWWSTNALADRADKAVRNAVVAQQRSARFVEAAMQVAHSGQSYVLTPSSATRDKFRREGQEAHDIAQTLGRDATRSSEVARAVARLDLQLSELESHLVRAHLYVDLSEQTAARLELEASVPFHAEMLRVVSELATAESNQLTTAVEAVQRSARYQGVVFFVVFAIAALAATFVTRWLLQTVATPLTRLAAHASAIAEQDNRAHTAEDSVPGEFRALAIAMNAASQSLVRVANAEAIANKNQRLALAGQLASGVAHELNNPLHTILLTVGLLLEDASDPTLRRELDVVRAQAARAREIVRDLMATARPGNGTRECVPADSIVRRAQDELTRLAGMHNARLVIALPAHSLANIEADRDDLTRLLGILVSNAAYIMKSEGSVTISADDVNGFCRFIVEDEGPGLDDDTLRRLFEPFFTTKPVGEGSGLGLPVALGIAESHGGAIVAENRTDRSGARFVVSIPHKAELSAVVLARRRVTPMSTLRILSSRPAINETSEPRVLIVDDEPTVRVVLSRILARAGWRFDEASDGAIALELIGVAEQAFDMYDLILCDLRMPRMSGMALHDLMVQQHPAALKRMIITSGDLSSPDIVSFMHRTACRVLEKPLDMAEVLRIAATARVNQLTVCAS
ncbi:MAG: hybrid sensor histidine kinase/response regulator [Gemmatimonas sp.]